MNQEVALLLVHGCVFREQQSTEASAEMQNRVLALLNHCGLCRGDGVMKESQASRT